MMGTAARGVDGIHISGGKRGDAEELKEASGGGAKESAVLGRVARRGRLGDTIGDAGDLKLGRNSGDGRHRGITSSSSSNQIGTGTAHPQRQKYVKRSIPCPH